MGKYAVAKNGDKIEHCVLACELQRECGKGTWLLMSATELGALGPLPGDASYKDTDANAVGVGVSGDCGECTELCEQQSTVGNLPN